MHRVQILPFFAIDVGFAPQRLGIDVDDNHAVEREREREMVIIR